MPGTWKMLRKQELLGLFHDSETLDPGLALSQTSPGSFSLLSSCEPTKSNLQPLTSQPASLTSGTQSPHPPSSAQPWTQGWTQVSVVRLTRASDTVATWDGKETLIGRRPRDRKPGPRRPQHTASISEDPWRPRVSAQHLQSRDTYMGRGVGTPCDTVNLMMVTEPHS